MRNLMCFYFMGVGQEILPTPDFGMALNRGSTRATCKWRDLPENFPQPTSVQCAIHECTNVVVWLHLSRSLIVTCSRHRRSEASSEIAHACSFPAF
jgi:hypothetical protein